MVTLKDIAQKAKVSVSTVSDVLNGKSKERRVSDDCAQRVRKIADKLNYKPNIAARGLIKRKTFLIGIIVDSMHSSFWGELLSGLVDTLEANDYRCIISLAGGDTEKANKAAEEMINRQVDGIACLGKTLPRASFCKKKPFIFSHSQGPYANTFGVEVCEVSGVKKACDHLIDYGHKNILLAGTYLTRLDIAQKYLKEAGIKYRRIKEFKPINFTSLSETAVFCGTDKEAIELLSLAQNQGLKLPKDLSIIGYDNISITEWVSPSLTSIHQPKQAYGETIAGLLLKLIEKENIQSVRLEPELIVRGSTSKIT